MKKIMFYCPVFYPQNTGYSNAFQNLISAILDGDSNVYITVVTPYPLAGQEEFSRERLDVVRLVQRLKIKKIKHLVNGYFDAKAVSKKFKDERYEMLFIETYESAIFINSLDSDIFNKALVRIHSTYETECTFFSNGIDFLVRRFLIKNFLIRKIKWVISTSSFHISFAKKYFYSENLIKIGNASFFVLPNSMDLQEVPDVGVGEKIKIFMLGRMSVLGNSQKGFTDFIYALKLLSPDVLGRFDITIVGEGPVRIKLMSLCRNLENVHFIESLTHAETLNALKENDVIVLPSRYEGLSMFALEGLATGNVCLFSKTGGLIDMIDGNGYFFDPQDIESLSHALEKIALIPKEEIVEMKRRSLEICSQKFSSKVVSKKFQVIYDLIVNS